MSQHLEGKNLVELLDMMEPVPEPPAISLMPQTPGWIVLGIIVVGLAFWAARALQARHRERAYRRAALAELAEIGNDSAKIATLLRRTALAGFPRDQVAGLVGEDWLNFLDQSYGGKGFSGEQGQVFLAAPYRQSAPDPALGALARDWITLHKSGHRQTTP